MTLFNIEKEILELVKGKDDIEFVTIGKGSVWGDSLEKSVKKEFSKRANKAMTWATFLMFLNRVGCREVENGYGEICLPPIVVWTSEKVIYLDEHDGAVSFRWVPRNPGPEIHENW